MIRATIREKSFQTEDAAKKFHGFVTYQGFSGQIISDEETVPSVNGMVYRQRVVWLVVWNEVLGES